MEVLCFIIIVILFCHSSYPSKVKKLERDVRKLKKLNGKELEMSKIITDLIGKTCKITKLDEMSFIEKTKILEVDEDWIKLEKTDKKNINSIEIIRIDDVKKIEEVVE